MEFHKQQGRLSLAQSPDDNDFSQDGPNALVVCDVQLYAETEKAIRVGKPGLRPQSIYDEKEKPWLPSALVMHSTLNGVGSVGSIEIPRYLAEQKELEYDEFEEDTDPQRWGH